MLNIAIIIIREIQSKTTVRYHLSLVRFAIIKNLQTINAGVSSEKREPSYTLVECKLKQLTRKTVWRFLKKLKIELSYDPEIPLLGIYQKQIIIQKDRCTPMLTAALFMIARAWKQPQ